MMTIPILSRLSLRLRLLLLAVVILVLIPVGWVSLKFLRIDNTGIWVPSAVSEMASGRYLPNNDVTDLVFLMCDHWEPGGGEAGLALSEDWLDRFEIIAGDHRDTQGRPFQYSWFYPIDNFDSRVLKRIARSVQAGFGEIEVHWHHRHPDSAAFANDLEAALEDFTEVGALISEPGGRPRWGFIHGNWTLDNSGNPKYCGVDDEIKILGDYGCYADFTFPALGNPAQPSTINQVFYAKDTPGPKSYEIDPVPAQVGQSPDGLMMFPGPLGFDFKNPWIFFEYGALDDAEGSGITGKFRRPDTYSGYFKEHRVDLWTRLGAGVKGRPEWVFVKIHAHGAQHRDVVLDGALDHMLESLEGYCQEKGINLHYVTTREAYNLVKAAEAGVDGSPRAHYDFEIPPPLNRQSAVVEN